MKWYVLEKGHNLNLPEWARTFGLEDGVVFIPAAVAQIPEIDVCRRLDLHPDLPLAQYDDHYYVPSGWLAYEFPEVADLCQLFEDQAKKASNKN